MDSRPLPPGWISQYDQGSGRYFYVETASGTTQWDDPRPAHYASQPSSAPGGGMPSMNMPTDGPGAPPPPYGGGGGGGGGSGPGAAPPMVMAMGMPGDTMGSSMPPGYPEKSGLPPAGAPFMMPGYGGGAPPPAQPGYNSSAPPAQPGYSSSAPPAQPGYNSSAPPAQPGYSSGGAPPAGQANDYYGGQPPAPGTAAAGGDTEKLGLGTMAGLAGGAGLMGAVLHGMGKLSGGKPSGSGGGFMSNMMGGGHGAPPAAVKPPKQGYGPMALGASALGGGVLGYMVGNSVGSHKNKHKQKHKSHKHKGWKGFKSKGWKGFKSKGWK